MLERIEGHWIRGYGDSQKPDVEIGLLNGATAEADAFLVTHEESRGRLDRVARLIDGFETPYGMELLASVHWVAAERGVSDEAGTVAQVHGWSDRKRRLFSDAHIRVAWQHLVSEG